MVASESPFLLDSSITSASMAITRGFFLVRNYEINGLHSDAWVNR